MELTLQVLLGMVNGICFLGGMNLMLKGAGRFLPEGTPATPALDNLFRFLSGIYFGLGFLVSWTLWRFHQQNELIYCIGIVVVFSGLGRLYSRSKVGSAGRYFDAMMLIEIVLGAVIILTQYLRVN